jgi:hypothetical protein
MYIRWKTRENQQGKTAYCYLCSGQRVAGKVKSSTLGYLGSIAVKPEASQRAVFWETVAAKLLALELSREDRVRIEALIAQRVQRGKNPHGDADACVEWYTPPEYVEMARIVLRGIDLDPASAAKPQEWIKAGTYYIASDDGMEQPGFGRVWCNPPYGKDQPKGRKAPDWLKKALSCYESGEIEAAILLLNRTGAAWYKQQLRRVTAICEVHKRIPFIDATGKQQPSPRYYNDFLYLGKEVEKFQTIFKAKGEVRNLV